MSEFDQPEVQASEYGKYRAEQWDRHLAESAEAASSASLERHATMRGRLVASKAGLFGHSTGEQLAATVAAHRPRVGDGAGAGRDLDTLGGTFDHAATGPAPARVDLTQVDLGPGQRPTGISPLLAFMQGREQ